MNSNQNKVISLKSVLEALSELHDAALAMETSYKTSDFLPKARRYFTALDNARAILAKVKGGE